MWVIEPEEDATEDSIQKRRFEILENLMLFFSNQIKDPIIDPNAFVIALIDVMITISAHGGLSRQELKEWINEVLDDYPEEVWNVK